MTHKVEFEHYWELCDHELTLTVKADINAYEENYGEDADGNRGQKMWFVEVEGISIFDARGNDLTSKIESKYESVYKTIVEEAENQEADL